MPIITLGPKQGRWLLHELTLCRKIYQQGTHSAFENESVQSTVKFFKWSKLPSIKALETSRKRIKTFFPLAHQKISFVLEI